MELQIVWRLNSKLAVKAKQISRCRKSGCFDTANYSVIKEITVGALPDMITFSGGNIIMTLLGGVTDRSGRFCFYYCG
jgi:hypothetical protein